MMEKRRFGSSTAAPVAGGAAHCQAAKRAAADIERHSAVAEHGQP
jgi:hypothetical protein